MAKTYFTKINLFKTVVLLAGMFVASLGVALSTRCGLGVSPLTSLPLVVSEISGITLGNLTIVLQVLFVFGEIILVDKKPGLKNLIQVIMAVFNGYFMDLCLMLVQNVNPATYGSRLLLCIGSILILALGIFLTVNSNLLMQAPEAFDDAVAKVTGLEFGTAKIVVDCVIVILAAFISYLKFQTFLGLREGTLISAIFCGIVIQMYNKPYRQARRIIVEGGAMFEAKGLSDKSFTPGKPHLVVTITREFGPNGVKVAKRLSELTGMKLYDDELSELAAKESGLDIEFVRKNDEYYNKGILQRLYANSFKYPYLHQSEPKEEILFRAQQRVIRRLAESEDCIILGRNANRALGKSPYYYHVFLHANPEWRLEQTMSEFNLTKKQANELIRKMDKQRMRHSIRFTGRRWGIASDYNMCLDIARTGVETSAQILYDAVKGFVYSPKLEA